MCLCDHPDGHLLVHRGPSSGGDGAPTSAPFPSLWHHGVERRESWRIDALSKRCLHARTRYVLSSVRCCLSRCVCSI